MPSLLQLPHLTTTLADELHKSKTISTVDELISLPEAERRKALADLGESEYADVVEVGKHWPRLEVIDASFSGAFFPTRLLLQSHEAAHA